MDATWGRTTASIIVVRPARGARAVRHRCSRQFPAANSDPVSDSILDVISLLGGGLMVAGRSRALVFAFLLGRSKDIYLR